MQLSYDVELQTSGYPDWIELLYQSLWDIYVFDNSKYHLFALKEWQNSDWMKTNEMAFFSRRNKAI
jgi:hypothetical protein